MAPSSAPIGEHFQFLLPKRSVSCFLFVRYYGSNVQYPAGVREVLPKVPDEFQILQHESCGWRRPIVVDDHWERISGTSVSAQNNS